MALAPDISYAELPAESSQTYIKLAVDGATWSCVLDRKNQLIWEVKTKETGLHHQHNRYTWYSTNTNNNGGFNGYRDKGTCQASACNSAVFIKMLNQQKFCGQDQWRLPTREELRSLVNYDIPFPGPTIDQHFFPNTLAQYYWTSSPDADDKDSAWGIGFSFGFDYAYFKSHAGYLRAVANVH